MTQAPLLILVLALVAGSAGCAGRKAAALPPPPLPSVAEEPEAAPQRAPLGPVAEPQTRAQLPILQEIPAGAAPPSRGPLPPLPEPAPAAPAEPVAQAPPPRRAPAPPPPAPEPAETAPVPQLGPILSAVEKQEYNQIIELNLQQARSRLAAVVGRNLDTDQKAAVKRIRAFLRQAEDAREQDLALARNLAERARVLAEDLTRNFR